MDETMMKRDTFSQFALRSQRFNVVTRDVVRRWVVLIGIAIVVGAAPSWGLIAEEKLKRLTGG
jgi:hypothetical protein